MGITGAVGEFERTAGDSAIQRYVLRLYIAGSTIRSQRAVENISKLCREFLRNNCELQVIDVFQQPLLAKSEQIFAVPTLIKKLPTPKRLFIGDMSDTNRILAGLGFPNQQSEDCDDECIWQNRR